MNRAKTTTDHDEIRRWAESRGGTPTAVKGTSRGKKDVGMIRIDFPGYTGANKLEPISWDEWFAKFDTSNLAMVLQEETAKGAKSHFNKIVGRESLESDESGKGMHVNKTKTRRARRRASTSKSAAKSPTSKSQTSKSRTSKSRASKSRPTSSKSKGRRRTSTTRT